MPLSRLDVASKVSFAVAQLLRPLVGRYQIVPKGMTDTARMRHVRFAVEITPGMTWRRAAAVIVREMLRDPELPDWPIVIERRVVAMHEGTCWRVEWVGCWAE